MAVRNTGMATIATAMRFKPVLIPTLVGSRRRIDNLPMLRFGEHLRFIDQHNGNAIPDGIVTTAIILGADQGVGLFHELGFAGRTDDDVEIGIIHECGRLSSE